MRDTLELLQDQIVISVFQFNEKEFVKVSFQTNLNNVISLIVHDKNCDFANKYPWRCPVEMIECGEIWVEDEKIVLPMLHKN